MDGIGVRVVRGKEGRMSGDRTDSRGWQKGSQRKDI